MKRITRGRAALTLAPPALLAIGAMLVGWGIDDLEGFFGAAARAALIAIIICEFVAGAFWRIELNPFRKGTRRGHRWPLLLGVAAIPVLWAAVAFCDRRNIFVFPGSSVIRWIGVAGFATGSVIRLAALHALGRQYSEFLTVQPEHQLIRDGIYRRIRHPFYLGGLLNLPGMLLAFRSPVSVIIFAISVVFVVNRIGREERLLTEAFPEAYHEYQQASWRLLPHLY